MCSLMKNFSIYSLAVASIAMASCSNPLDKPFDRETAEADFARIVKLDKIDSADAYIMSHFMVEHDLIGSQVLELNATYRDILKESKDFWSKSKGLKKGDSDREAEKNTESVSNDLTVVIQPVAGSVQQSPWSHGIKYQISLENIGSKKVRAVKGNLVLVDSFGDRLQTIEYKYLDEIAPSEKITREVTVRLQNQVNPQLIVEFGNSIPFEVKWEPLQYLYE